MAFISVSRSELLQKLRDTYALNNAFVYSMLTISNKNVVKKSVKCICVILAGLTAGDDIIACVYSLFVLFMRIFVIKCIP